MIGSKAPKKDSGKTYFNFRGSRNDDPSHFRCLSKCPDGRPRALPNGNRVKWSTNLLIAILSTKRQAESHEWSTPNFCSNPLFFAFNIMNIFYSWLCLQGSAGYGSFFSLNGYIGYNQVFDSMNSPTSSTTSISSVFGARPSASAALGLGWGVVLFGILGHSA